MKKNTYALIAILGFLFCCFTSRSMAGNEVSGTKDVVLSAGQKQIESTGMGGSESIHPKGVHPRRVVR